MNFNWFKKKKPLTEALSELSAVLETEPTEVNEFGWLELRPALNGLPMVVADDDFLEFLAEEGYGDSIELDDLMVLYAEWEADNVDTSKTEAYCVFCKETVPMLAERIKISDSGRRMAMGYCAYCSKKVNKILGREE